MQGLVTGVAGGAGLQGQRALTLLFLMNHVLAYAAVLRF